jgi:hypothetical protein
LSDARPELFDVSTLADTASFEEDAEDGCLSLRLDRWLVQGQGAMAVW